MLAFLVPIRYSYNDLLFTTSYGSSEQANFRHDNIGGPAIVVWRAEKSEDLCVTMTQGPAREQVQGQSHRPDTVELTAWRLGCRRRQNR